MVSLCSVTASEAFSVHHKVSVDPGAAPTGTQSVLLERPCCGGECALKIGEVQL